MEPIIKISDEAYNLLKSKPALDNIAESIIANGTPYNPTGDCISREQIRKSLNKAFGCENATKYGNQNAEQQNVSYSTLMLYEIADIVEDCCDNAPTVEPICPYLSDNEIKQPCLNSPCERPQGEWVEFEYEMSGGYRCSNCENIEVYKPNFCPNCGADMRKGGAE